MIGRTNTETHYRKVKHQGKPYELSDGRGCHMLIKPNGDAPYRQIINEARRELKAMRSDVMPNSCFVAGTLVHTKEGLRPIEEIKVGDYVLSRNQDNTGDQEYKRVTRTMVFDDQEVMRITSYPIEEKIHREDARAKKEYYQIPEEALRSVIVTPNHPFWVKGSGWLSAQEIFDMLWDFDRDNDLELVLANGSLAVVGGASLRLKRSLDPNIGWAQLFDIESGFGTDRGTIVDFNLIGEDAEKDLETKKYCEAFGVNPVYHNAYAGLIGNPKVQWELPENIYRTKVYNIEVEDYHTYYVSTMGVWVHNASCVQGTGITKNQQGLGVVKLPDAAKTVSDTKNLTSPQIDLR